MSKYWQKPEQDFDKVSAVWKFMHVEILSRCQVWPFVPHWHVWYLHHQRSPFTRWHYWSHWWYSTMMFSHSRLALRFRQPDPYVCSYQLTWWYRYPQLSKKHFPIVTLPTTNKINFLSHFLSSPSAYFPPQKKHYLIRSASQIQFFWTPSISQLSSWRTKQYLSNIRSKKDQPL